MHKKFKIPHLALILLFLLSGLTIGNAFGLINNSSYSGEENFPAQHMKTIVNQFILSKTTVSLSFIKTDNQKQDIFEYCLIYLHDFQILNDSTKLSYNQLNFANQLSIQQDIHLKKSGNYLLILQNMENLTEFASIEWKITITQIDSNVIAIDLIGGGMIFIILFLDFTKAQIHSHSKSKK
ncbi:MAG: hypothetical protein ACTSWL_09835 [Promethearchaeota archaeon]